MDKEELDIMVKKCSKGSAYLSELIREQLNESFLIGREVGYSDGYRDGTEVAEGMYTRYD